MPEIQLTPTTATHRSAVAALPDPGRVALELILRQHLEPHVPVPETDSRPVGLRLYEVTRKVPGESIRVRDHTSPVKTELWVASPEASERLRLGDLFGVERNRFGELLVWLA